ncbi:MAG: hypothetical protein AB7I59_02830 [Geminicoccaceae bacterium]
MWKPWVGEYYDAARLLLLGESAYDWRETDGELRTPTERHSIDLVEWVIGDFDACCRRDDGIGFMVKLSRALTANERPTQAQLQCAWDRVAFTNYVPHTIGAGARLRPSRELWETAREEFPQLLADLDPDRVIVLGKELWSRMPKAQVYISDEMQGYVKSNGEVAYCYAVKHPSAGVRWRDLAALIHFACGKALRKYENRPEAQ